MPEMMYRYHERVVVPYEDEYDRVGLSYVEILICDEYPVLRRTAKGVWLDRAQGYCMDPEKKFVLDNAKRRWAWPTQEEALESFKARKRAQIRILQQQLRLAKEALAMADDARTHVCVPYFRREDAKSSQLCWKIGR